MGVPQNSWFVNVDTLYHPLVMSDRLLLKMAIEIVDLPI